MRTGGYARRRHALVYSLVVSSKLGNDLVLQIAGAAEARAVVAVVCCKPAALALVLEPPGGLQWPRSWNSREIHMFEGGRIVSSCTIFSCRETFEFRVKIVHLIATALQL